MKTRVVRIARSPTKKILISCCCFALWTICHAGVVQAHATLLQTEPPSGSQLDDAPSKVLLAFNERVESIFNSIEVLDRDARRVDVGDPRVVGDGDTLEIGLKNLGEGQYTVRWRVNSLDGHQVQGRFGFGVKSPPPTEAEMNNLSVPQQSTAWKLFLLVAKWAGLVAMVAWIGGVSFWVVIFGPSIPGDWQTVPGLQPIIQAAVRRTCRILWTAAVLFFVAQIFALVGQGMTFADLPIGEALSPATMRTVLTATSYGHWWCLRMLAALGLLGVCGWRMRPSVLIGSEDRSSVRSGASLAVGAGFLGGFMLLTVPMSGHAQAVPRAMALAVGCDWMHMAATAVWIGGLIFLWAVVLLVDNDKDDKGAFLSTLVARFSRVARISVLALVVTGIYTAWLHVPTWRSFVTTDYGRVLLIKLFLVSLILLIAAVNWRRVLPALAGFSRRVEIYRKWASRFRLLVSAEAMLGVAVLVSVALLTSLPPATAVANTGPVSLSKQNEDVTVNLNLDSARVGTIHSSITLKDSSGRAITDARQVTFYLRMLDMDMGLQTVEAQPTSGGAYQADLPFPMAGRWSVSIQVSPSHGDAFVTDFNISTASL